MKQKVLFFLLAFLPLVAWSADDETEGEGPMDYAVLTDDGKTVTFYYDTEKANRSNVVGIQTGKNDWFYRSAVKAVFDASIANYLPTSTEGWFYGCEELETIEGLNYLNTENVTDMYGMFGGCYSLKSLDLRSFNTANVTNIRYMFGDCSSLTSVNLSSFNTEKVERMGSLFEDCSSLTSIDLSSFNTKNVENMQGMFSGCTSLTSLDLSGFNTENVIYFSSMFKDCSSLTNLDLTSFNTEKVYLGEKSASLSDMFWGCSSLETIDLSSFNTAKVEGMDDMFRECTSLTTIYVSDLWTTKDVTNSGNMFLNCVSLVGGQGTTFDENHIDATYAHVDGGVANPGYLTQKSNTSIRPVQENGIKTSEQSDDYYDLSGRIVDHLTKGLYIVNGKKVVVK